MALFSSNTELRSISAHSVASPVLAGCSAGYSFRGVRAANVMFLHYAILSVIGVASILAVRLLAQALDAALDVDVGVRLPSPEDGARPLCVHACAACVMLLSVRFAAWNVHCGSDSSRSLWLQACTWVATAAAAARIP